MQSKPINRFSLILLIVAVVLFVLSAVVAGETVPGFAFAIPGVACLVAGIVLAIRSRR